MGSLDELGLRIKVPFVTPSSRSYRPPSWPPPRDWCCIEDAKGNAVSRWGDPIWDLTPWAGRKMALNFGDGPECITPIDRANADLLRLVVTWRVWGPRGIRTCQSLKYFFTPIRAIIALCSREEILASNLMRFTEVAAKLPQVLAPSQFDATVSQLSQLLDARSKLGFILLDKHGLKRLVAAKPEHKSEQTEYIPPRIWAYQVNRLKECLDDYLANKQQVEDCFKFCIDAYALNYGSLTAALTSKPILSRNPFTYPLRQNYGVKTGVVFYGQFRDAAVKFGILKLLERWIGGDISLRNFAGYLTLIQQAGLCYLLNFSLMRREEGNTLRADCLYFENDEKLGKIPILCGETTKTDPDSDARWPTSQSVEVAIDAMKSVSSLRMQCAAANPIVAPSDEDIDNQHLVGRAFEPWAGGKSVSYSIKPPIKSYSEFIKMYPLLFDDRILENTEQDLRIAHSVCPTLNKKKFQLGKPWRLAFHQLRRTGAVNMFASGLLSDSSMQFLLKHRTRAMPLYYGRGSSTLALNEEARALLVTAQYEVMGRELAAVLSDRFVSPYGDEHKKKMVADLMGEPEVNLLSEEDARHFEAAAQKGIIPFRTTVLGGCMKKSCSGDCIESIANCSGGNGKSPCRDVLFDRQRSDQNQLRLDGIKVQLQSAQPSSPRYRALEQEKRGLENYFDYIKRGW